MKTELYRQDLNVPSPPAQFNFLPVLQLLFYYPSNSVCSYWILLLLLFSLIITHLEGRSENKVPGKARYKFDRQMDKPISLFLVLHSRADWAIPL